MKTTTNIMGRAGEIVNPLRVNVVPCKIRSWEKPEFELFMIKPDPRWEYVSAGKWRFYQYSLIHTKEKWTLIPGNTSFSTKELGSIDGNTPPDDAFAWADKLVDIDSEEMAKRPNTILHK